MKKLTIVDIAKMAGVGSTTVSRYFNGGNLKKETREKIKKIVEEYNYTPNTFAKALKGTDSKIIGVIVPCLHSYVSSNTLKYIDKNLKENNYETLIMNADFVEEKEPDYIRKLARMNVDGIILLPTTMSKSYESTIKSIDVPVVLLGQEGEYTYRLTNENIDKLKKATCLICATDNLAYGAIKALEENGLNIGTDYSVAAFGDYASSALLKSPLTTIKFDLEDAAKKTVEMLLNVIKKKETEMKILIGYDLKTRSSVVDLNNL